MKVQVFVTHLVAIHRLAASSQNERSESNENRHHEQHRVYLVLGWTHGNVGSCRRDGKDCFWHPWVEHFLVGCVRYLSDCLVTPGFAMQGTSPFMPSSHPEPIGVVYEPHVQLFNAQPCATGQ